MRHRSLAYKLAWRLTLWGVAWVGLLDAVVGVLTLAFVRPDLEWEAAFLRDEFLRRMEGPE